VVFGWALVSVTLLQNLILSDAFVFHVYGFHLNAFVWNLLFTRGGIESMGGSASTFITVGAVVLGTFALYAGLLFLALRGKRVRAFASRLVSRRARLVFAAATLAILFLTQAVAYGLFSLWDYTPATVAANVFPANVRFTFAGLAERWFGLKPAKKYAFKAEAIALHYPLKPLEFRPDRKRLNMVWLVAESWRFDMLDPRIMPATWAFSGKAARFEQHFSGGHGTRMGVFGLFYGLYCAYWDSFYTERRGPVLMDVVVDGGYQMKMLTSAMFTYPEFDRTVFARVPPEDMQECDEGEGWQRDRINVGRVIDFIAGRDSTRPFMTFLFLESPHARYTFPPECAIATPYREDVNYVTMNLGTGDSALIKNRYVNSCNHLDTQFARIIDCLEKENLLDSTIVVMTGDHGEEFREKGRWGHNSTFSDEQTKVPLVLWIPGRSPERIERMTSHLDVPATVLDALGVTNDPGDYSLGENLFSGRERPYLVLSGHEDLCYVDREFKAVFPVGSSSGSLGEALTDRQDRKLPGRKDFVASHRDRILQIMRDLKRFRR
jgi:membrane-anchored protein YejM (alkaline phosphatase superfamily)